MKASKLFVSAMGGAACMALYACGGHSNAVMTVPPMPTQPQVTTLAPADVLAKAKVQSETDDALAVNGGAVVVTPANDESSDSIAVE